MQFKRQLGCRPTCNRVRGSGTRQQRWRETWEMQCLWPRIRLCSASEDAHEGQAQCEARWGQLAIGRRMGESGSVLCVQMCRCAVCVQMTSCLEENAAVAHLATRALFIMNTNFNKKPVLATSFITFLKKEDRIFYWFGRMQGFQTSRNFEHLVLQI